MLVTAKVALAAMLGQIGLPGGGFGLQVVRGGTTREVKVELGMFAEGRVEVSGGGLREGMKVGVPKI